MFLLSKKPKSQNLISMRSLFRPLLKFIRTILHKKDVSELTEEERLIYLALKKLQ